MGHLRRAAGDDRRDRAGLDVQLSQSARTAMTSLIIVGAILAIINNTRNF